ncbi:MAG: hypothetical protein QM778_00190 [Myxococcales bacterium]
MRSSPRWPAEFTSSAELLLKAALVAEAVDRSRWDFAVEIGELRNVGLTLTDFRWLICQGLLEHQTEIHGSLSDNRLFQPTGSLTFEPHTCFVLTDLGRRAVLLLDLAGISTQPNVSTSASLRISATKRRPQAKGEFLSSSKPFWNHELRHLLWGSLLVKEYKHPAPNQELILTTFQREDWPSRIENPLSEEMPKRRLHDTIATLNRGQLHAVLHFYADGNASGVCWSSQQQPELPNSCDIQSA